MKNKRLDMIVCPNCGYEYLPVEIYIPNAFFGKPYDILRDDDGKIVSVVGSESDTFEEYCCDKCNIKFKVHARISFESETSKHSDFDSDYYTDIHKDVLELNEE